MIRKTAKLGLAALVLLAGLTAGAAAADAQVTQDVQVEDGDATQIDVVTSDNSCPVIITSGASTQCGGGGGSPTNPCNLPGVIC